MGPKGRSAILDQSYGVPRITKDGVTVAKSIEFSNKFQNMGAQLVRQVTHFLACYPPSCTGKGLGGRLLCYTACGVVVEGFEFFWGGCVDAITRRVDGRSRGLCRSPAVIDSRNKCWHNAGSILQQANYRNIYDPRRLTR